MVAALLFAATLCMPRAAAQKANKPLSKNDVIELLEGEVEPTEIGNAARSHGITFEMNSATEKELRSAGANDGLINVLRQLAPKPVTEAPPSSNTPSSAGAPILLIEATPGGAQVYIDDEPKATTSPSGRVRFSQLGPGEHVVRLSLAGYRDYEQKVELKSGQTSTVYATLEAARAASSTPAVTSQPGGLAVAGSTTTTPAAGSQTPSSGVSNANAVKFLVAHDHGLPAGQNACVGWMTVGGGMIHYQGLRAVTQGQMGGPTHSFDISADEIKEVKKNGVYLAVMGGFHIRLKKGTNNNFYGIDAQGRYQPPDALLNAIDSLGRR